MKTVVPLAVLSAAKYIEQYGQSAVMLLTAPDALCTYEIPAAKVLAEWVLENCGPEDDAEPDATEPPSEPEFTPGYCAANFESFHFTQRHMLYAAWDGGGLIATDQAYPKMPTRRYTAETIEPSMAMLNAVWGCVIGKNKPMGGGGPMECRLYRDDAVLYVAVPDMVWVVPHDDNGRVEMFLRRTFHDSWIFDGSGLPPKITSRPAAMAAFRFAGLV